MLLVVVLGEKVGIRHRCLSRSGSKLAAMIHRNSAESNIHRIHENSNTPLIVRQ